MSNPQNLVVPPLLVPMEFPEKIVYSDLTGDEEERFSADDFSEGFSDGYDSISRPSVVTMFGLATLRRALDPVFPSEGHLEKNNQEGNTTTGQ